MSAPSTTAAMAIGRVLVLDDLAVTRKWLADIVAEAFPGAGVTFAESVKAGLAAVAGQAFDLALLDLGLDDGSGLEVLAACRATTPPPVAVVTTVFDDDRNLFAALRAGANGYLLKDRPAGELAAALRGILSGQPPLSPAMATRMLAFFAPQPDRAESPLTARESDVLVMLSKGYTNGETARALALSPNTVAGYVKDIYRKLQVSNRAEAALEAQRRGLLDPG